MKHIVLAILLVLGAVAGCATPSGSDCCERKEIKKELREEGKGYFDQTGKYHDHSIAMTATKCYCGDSCDRKTKCCGPDHCVCNPN